MPWNTTTHPDDLLNDPRIFSLHLLWSFIILLSFAALVPLDPIVVYVCCSLLLLGTGAHVPTVTGQIAQYMLET